MTKSTKKHLSALSHPLFVFSQVKPPPFITHQRSEVCDGGRQAEETLVTDPNMVAVASDMKQLTGSGTNEQWESTARGCSGFCDVVGVFGV